MDLKKTLETALELHKVLMILLPSDQHAEPNRQFVAFFLLSVANGRIDLNNGFAAKIAEKYLESRSTPLTDVQKEIWQEFFDEIAEKGLALPYVIKEKCR